ncbi:hypothetical protein [Pseudoclavibacter sp. AY1H1]|uniref:hypothetical protein n=1 Tax=Pseudoclavibacter sp. AY1H1 TaxID=2080584 RepID=UPI000CE7E1F5|nr:hypothetical protein [Pseudoclavibacter sp. AY1H1]PPF33589.1 hypothetical protein C5E05_17285 [Pseudoclavibacter sp. AY1H1]
MNASEWIALVSAVVAAVSLVIALDANRRAIQANRISGEGNEIAELSLEAQRRALPPEWTALQSADGSNFTLANQSSKHIEVLSFTADPPEYDGLVSLDRDCPFVVEHGDAFSVNSIRTMAGGAERLLLRWRYQGELEEHETQRLL